MARRSSSGSSRVDRVLYGDDRRDIRWWRAGKDEPHNAVFDAIRRISRSTSRRQREAVYYACLYDDSELAALLQGSQALGEFTPQTMTTNLVKRQVNAFVAQISKNRPVPMALTTGGNYAQQRRAKQLSKFFEGVLDEVGYWDTRKMRLRDGALFGSGLALNYRVGRKLHHDRVFPWEVWVDPREAQYGKPRTLYLVRYVDRAVLAERFPDKAEIIRQAEGRFTDAVWDIGWDETSDLVATVWSWHLPNGEASAEDAKSGRYCLSVSTGTLEDRGYIRDYFPFSKFDFSPGVVGWWGEGLAKDLDGLQFEVNSIGLRLQEHGWMTGTYVWAGPPSETGLELEHLDNGVLTQIVSEQKPDFFAPNPWHPQLFDYYMALRGRFAAEETRLSEMATRGEKPPGLDSGKAIRAWRQLDTDAFGPQQDEDERDTMDTCWQLFDLCEEIYTESQAEKGKGQPYEIRVEDRRYGKNVLKDIRWSDVRMDRDEFTLRVFPTSFLQGTPAEKYQSVKELMADGLLSQDEALALIDFPDLQRVLNLRGAARRLIEKILTTILESSDPESAYVPPKPAMNLKLCRALGLMTFLDAYTDDADAENLFWVLQFALDAEDQLNAAGGAAAPPPPDGGAPPLDGGMPPPDDGGLYAPPPEQPLPAGAAPPGAMAPVAPV